MMNMFDLFRVRAVVRLLAIFAVIFSILVAACSANQPQRLPVDPDKLSLVSKAGEQKAEFEIEIAAETRQQSIGLMHRQDLPRDRGMLFIFPDVGQRAFWMKNTPASLDIVYADGDGVIVSIARATVPFSTDLIPSGAPARYVFEVLSGVASEVGMVVGDKLVHPRIGAVEVPGE